MGAMQLAISFDENCKLLLCKSYLGEFDSADALLIFDKASLAWLKKVLKNFFKGSMAFNFQSFWKFLTWSEMIWDIVGNTFGNTYIKGNKRFSMAH